jgi:cytochrome c oxidase assembly factor CtaG
MHAFTLALLLGAAALYGAGVRRLWQRAGRGRGVAVVNVSLFGSGMAVLAIAALSPLHDLGEALLWAHMIQHELLMVVAAPLLVLGRPMQAFAWVYPVRVPQWLSDPLLAWTLHAGAIVGWHLPGVFVAATASEGLHFAQHASFLGSALLFWWTIFARPGLAGIVSLFGTMLYTGALGALMTFARASWYPGYALEDQQLAGLVMWLPAGLAYPAAALAIVGSQWLRRSGA